MSWCLPIIRIVYATPTVMCTHLYTVHMHTCTCTQQMHTHAPIHTCTYSHTHTHAYMHIHTHARMHTCNHVCMHTNAHTHAHMHMCTHAHMHICTNMHIYTYIHSCTCSHMHTSHMYICTHVHMHIHVYTVSTEQAFACGGCTRECNAYGEFNPCGRQTPLYFELIQDAVACGGHAAGQVPPGDQGCRGLRARKGVQVRHGRRRIVIS